MAFWMPRIYLIVRGHTMPGAVPVRRVFSGWSFRTLSAQKFLIFPCCATGLDRI